MADYTPNDIAEHFVEMREFVSAGFNQARTDLEGGLAGLRSELKGEVAGVQGEIAGVRGEMHSGFARIDARFDRLESKIDAFITVQSQINRELLDR